MGSEMCIRDSNLSLREGFDAQIQDLQQKLDTARQSSSSDINRLTSVSNDLQGQVELLVEANEAAQAGIVERDAQIHELTGERDELLNQKAGLDETINTISAERDEAVAAAAQMNDQVTELSGKLEQANAQSEESQSCLLYTSPSPRDLSTSRMPSSA